MTNFLISRQLIIRDLRNEVEARRERGVIAADRRGEKEEINPRARTFRTLGRTAINPNSRLLIMHADELSVARFSGVNQLLLSGRLFPTGEPEGRETNPRRTRGCYLPVCQKSRTSPGGWINKLTPRRAAFLTCQGTFPFTHEIPILSCIKYQASKVTNLPLQIIKYIWKCGKVCTYTLLHSSSIYYSILVLIIFLFPIYTS